MFATPPIVRHALRRLARAPGFALAATLTLMLGIGGATAVFTLVNGVLLQPLAFERAEQLVDLSHTLALSGVARVDQSDATYLVYRRDNRVFVDVGAYRAAAVNLGEATASERDGGPAAERTAAAFVTAGLFKVLRAPAARGRVLSEDDVAIGAPATIVIGHRLWAQRFGSDPGIVGKQITVDGVSRSIVGVMPASFQFPTTEAQLWLPLVLDPANIKSAAFDYRGIARLRAGATPGMAAADLERLLPRVPEVFPGRLTVAAIKQIHMQPVVRPLRDVIVGDVGRVLWIVLGAVGLLLAIACANVANLFLARAEGRQRELVVRRALGAGRGVLLMEFVSEAAILAVAGASLGLAGAAVAVRALQSIGLAHGTPIPRLADVGIDGNVLALTASLAALAAIVVSAVPVMRLDTSSLSQALAAGGRAATSSPTRHRARRAMVIAQVALALVLLVAAGLLARTFSRLRSVDPGFSADHALTWRLSLPAVTYPSARATAGVILRAVDAVSALPGVRSVGIATKLPLDGESRQDSAVFVEDHPLPPRTVPNIHEMVFITPSYFEAMGIPLLSGRLFARSDDVGAPAQGPPEVIVSEAFAARYWKGASAIGKRVRMNPTDPWHTIVGVVGSVRDVALDQPPVEVVYSPLVTLNAAGKPWTPRDIAFVARTTGDPATIAGSVRLGVGTIDPALPLYRVMPVRALVSQATARTTFTLFLLGVAAAVATAIGALGIYGVISYFVSLRTREIGVRLALGAQRSDVRQLVARQALTDAIVGVVVGLVGAVASTRALGGVLFGVSPTDLATLATAAALLLVTAFVASWIPARRAAALDPVCALRAE